MTAFIGTSNLAPDRRMAVEQIDAQHGNPVRRAAILGAHAASLVRTLHENGFRAEVFASTKTLLLD
jgi:hypothetical protein